MINQTRLFKYLTMLIVVTLSTKYIPTCGVLQSQAIYVGLIASTTYAMIDSCMPHIIIIERESTQ